MIKSITFLTGISSVFGGVFITYNQFMVMQSKIEANERTIQALLESNRSLQESTTNITNVLVAQNGTLDQIQSTVSTMSDTTPNIIASNTTTILYVIGIAMFLGAVCYFSLPSNATIESLCKNGSLEAVSLLQKDQNDTFKNIVEKSSQALNHGVYSTTNNIDTNLKTVIRTSTDEITHKLSTTIKFWCNLMNNKLDVCLSELKNQNLLNNNINLPPMPMLSTETLPTTTPVATAANSPTLSLSAESIMTLPSTPVPGVTNTLSSTSITETVTITLSEVGSTAASEIMSTSITGVVDASLSGNVSPDLMTAGMGYLEPSAFFIQSF